MNRKTKTVLLLVSLVIIASGAFVLLTKKDKAPAEQKNEQTQSNTPATPNTPTPTPLIKGEYTDYSAEKLTATKGTKLLFFHASWCPQCRALEASIKASELPSNLTVFKVDYDSNQVLRAKYGVTLQTTIVKVDESGNKLASYVAYDEPNFQSVAKALLP